MSLIEELTHLLLGRIMALHFRFQAYQFGIRLLFQFSLLCFQRLFVVSRLLLLMSRKSSSAKKTTSTKKTGGTALEKATKSAANTVTRTITNEVLKSILKGR